MKLELHKKQLVNLSKDNNVLPDELTPQVGGGNNTVWCPPPSVDSPNRPGCNISDRQGLTMACCEIP